MTYQQLAPFKAKPLDFVLKLCLLSLRTTDLNVFQWESACDVLGISSKFAQTQFS